MWYAGIDWADDHHDTVVIDITGQAVLSLRVDHTATGLAELTAALTQITGPDAKDQLACIVGPIMSLLIAALLEAGSRSIPSILKPLIGGVAPRCAKTDQIDAYLLAKTGRSDLADLRRLIPDSPLIQELRH
jgi:hypothetical protein